MLHPRQSKLPFVETCMYLSCLHGENADQSKQAGPEVCRIRLIRVRLIALKVPITHEPWQCRYVSAGKLPSTSIWSESRMGPPGSALILRLDSFLL